ncbi:MAG: cardiolipin synthase [Planctomycetota bacterium]
MGRWWLIALAANYCVALPLALHILSRRRKEPAGMTAWILALLTLPCVGVVVYWLFGSNRLRRKVKRRRRRVLRHIAAFRAKAEQRAARDEPGREQLPEDLAAIAGMAERLADMPPVGGNEILVLRESNATYAALETALRAARHHIHMQYYIWQPDETGYAFRDLVIERARAGVECRLLLDAVGSFWLGRKFLQPLLDAGVRVAFFLPLARFPLRKRWSLHLRNHRKIVIVDGQVGFTGSQNIGDEYRGRRRKLSPWYDTHLRLSGPATLFLQQVFAEDWYLATREHLDGTGHFPQPERPGRSLVQIVATGPDQIPSILGQIVFAAVSSARESIRIGTPYFVPDPPTLMALQHACYRGVQVRLVLPTRTDVWLADWAARSFYSELVEAGVEIYEYDAGVLHSKIMTVDDRWCMVGSANLDARSFRLNFEITALVYDQAVAAELARATDSFARGARRIGPRAAWERGTVRRIGEGAARLFAPLL